MGNKKEAAFAFLPLHGRVKFVLWRRSEFFNPGRPRRIFSNPIILLLFSGHGSVDNLVANINFIH